MWWTTSVVTLPEHLCEPEGNWLHPLKRTPVAWKYKFNTCLSVTLVSKYTLGPLCIRSILKLLNSLYPYAEEQIFLVWLLSIMWVKCKDHQNTTKSNIQPLKCLTVLCVLSLCHSVEKFGSTWPWVCQEKETAARPSHAKSEQSNYTEITLKRWTWETTPHWGHSVLHIRADVYPQCTMCQISSISFKWFNFTNTGWRYVNSLPSMFSVSDMELSVGVKHSLIIIF